jgi:hypothetical protein
MDQRSVQALLRTLVASARPVRSFTETTSPDGATKVEISFFDGPQQVDKETADKPREGKKDKVPDWQLAARRAPLFEAPKQ